MFTHHLTWASSDGVSENDGIEWEKCPNYAISGAQNYNETRCGIALENAEKGRRRRMSKVKRRIFLFFAGKIRGISLEYLYAFSYVFIAATPRLQGLAYRFNQSQHQHVPE